MHGGIYNALVVRGSVRRSGIRRASRPEKSNNRERGMDTCERLCDKRGYCLRYGGFFFGRGDDGSVRADFSYDGSWILWVMGVRDFVWCAGVTVAMDGVADYIRVFLLTRID